MPYASSPYYAKNYAGIIYTGLSINWNKQFMSFPAERSSNFSDQTTDYFHDYNSSCFKLHLCIHYRLFY